MKSIKILLAPLFLVLLLSFASAIVVSGEWQDGSQSITINEGDDVEFAVEAFSMNPAMTLNITLYDSADEIVNDFEGPITETSNGYPKTTFSIPTVSPSGTYELIIIGTDQVESQTETLTLTVNPSADTTAPTITLVGANPQNILVGDAYTELGATASDDTDGDITSSITIDASNVETSAVGTYIVTYNVDDAAGNSATEVTRDVIVSSTPIDTTAPVVNIITPNDGQAYASVNYFNVQVTDENLDSCSYILNDAPLVPISCVSEEPISVNIVPIEGENTLSVTATDDAGLTTTESITFTIDPSLPDTTAPTINVISPSATEYDSNTITFEVITDENATVEMSLDGQSSIPMSNPTDHIFKFTLTGIANGEHTVDFTATDSEGNTATETITFTINVAADSADDSTSGSVQTLGLENELSPEEQAYLDQFNPDTLFLEDDTPQEESTSFIQKIINAIINFFKRLFGLK